MRLNERNSMRTKNRRQKSSNKILEARVEVMVINNVSTINTLKPRLQIGPTVQSSYLQELQSTGSFESRVHEGLQKGRLIENL